MTLTLPARPSEVTAATRMTGVVDTALVTPRALAEPDSPQLARVLNTVAARYSCRPAVAAALWWKQYSWFVVAAALDGWMAAELPDLSADGCRVRLAEEPPVVTVLPGASMPCPAPANPVPVNHATADPATADPAASDPAASDPAASDPAAVGMVAFASWMRTEVIVGHLEPIVANLQSRTRVGRRVLWGSVAHALALPLSERLPEPEIAVPRLLTEIGPPVAGLVDLCRDGRGEVEVTRRTCCLAFRSNCGDGGGPALCSYCPVTRSANDHPKA